MSDPNFSSEITLLTRSGVVNPLCSIKNPLRFSYFRMRNGCNKTSLTSDATSSESAARVNLYLSSSSVISCRSN